jgi:hypothetical protein
LNGSIPPRWGMAKLPRQFCDTGLIHECFLAADREFDIEDSSFQAWAGRNVKFKITEESNCEFV